MLVLRIRFAELSSCVRRLSRILYWDEETCRATSCIWKNLGCAEGVASHLSHMLYKCAVMIDSEHLVQAHVQAVTKTISLAKCDNA